YLRQRRSAGDQLCYSVITKAELYAGLRSGEETALMLLLDSMQELIIDGSIAEQGGKYRQLFLKSHQLQLADALIAATAKIAHAKLITLNTKHFPMTDIVVESPY
ncbi:MAG: type II toxin-antitoxin system VapC family toxin, partial [Candidatus Poribacteria bacterium]|nr:type II toxin-antitoxin system VapC family toxin [Candidatus Poribacteria bacterium]